MANNYYEHSEYDKHKQMVASKWGIWNVFHHWILKFGWLSIIFSDHSLISSMPCKFSLSINLGTKQLYWWFGKKPFLHWI